MRIAALVVATAAALCFAGAARLWVKTWHFFQSSAYAPNSAHMPGYTAGNVEADGSGIFLPVVLILALGLFLAKFAWNLWTGERKPRRSAGSSRKSPLQSNEERDRHG